MEWNEIKGREALKFMQKRASCRSFSQEKIPEDLLKEILSTGLCAASGGNLQPYSIIVIKDTEKRNKVMELCGNQKFIGEAPVNLLFVLDWYKMSVFAENEKAPYTCPDSYMHYLIALEDVMCTAQSIETAAHLCGIASCYVGSTNHCGKDLVELFNLPKHTYPVLLLSLGYPKSELTVRKKLDYDFMVFDERYPDLTYDTIVENFRNKYGDTSTSIPSTEPYRQQMLDKLKSSLQTTYTPPETEKLLEAAIESGKINETQRRFGLHYHALDMRNKGVEIIKMMEDNGLTPFIANKL